MFNLLGNLLFGYRQENEENNNAQADDLTTTTTSANQATQTIENANPNECASQAVAETSQVDWVIVDRNEEAEHNGDATVTSGGRNDASTNTHSMIQSQQEPAAEKKSALLESTTTILGSFFEKNADEDEEFNRKYTSSAKDWLITPLPCLTSITASQRSIVENDPLENLLIEHPSMSVFVAATSASASEDDSFADEDMIVETPTPKVMVKSVSEKRKCTVSPVQQAEQSSPTASLKRKGKKNKKSTAAVSPSLSAVSCKDKENVQQQPQQQPKQALTANDFKKSTNLARLETLLLNKNQMKRANKNSVFGKQSNNNVNNKQRKYHMLQQPLFLSKPVF